MMDLVAGAARELMKPYFRIPGVGVGALLRDNHFLSHLGL